MMRIGKHISAESRREEERKKRKKRRIVLLILMLIMVVVVSAEISVLISMSSVDSRFVRSIERGVINGWESKSGEMQLRETGYISDITFIYRELEATEEFLNKSYKDRNLSRLTKQYVSALKKCRMAGEKYGPTENPEEFWEGFVKPYTERVTVLREVYLGDFRMGDGWKQHPQDLGELLLRAWVIEKAQTIKFEKKEELEGVDKYAAWLKNDSGYDIQYLNMDVELFGKGSNVVGTAEVTAENLKNEDVCYLSFYCSDKGLSSYKITDVDCISGEIRGSEE